MMYAITGDPAAEASVHDVEMETVLIAEDDETEDPVLIKARSLADSDLLHISVHADLGEMGKELENSMVHSTKSLCFIEAPTSKTNIVMQMMTDTVTVLPTGTAAKFLVFVLRDHASILLHRSRRRQKLCGPSWPTLWSP